MADNVMNDDQMTRLMTSLDKLTNIHGLIGSDQRARLYAVVEDPNQSTWNDAYSIIVNAGKDNINLWRACVRYSSYTVMSKPADGTWPLIPSREDIINALEWAGKTYPPLPPGSQPA